MADKEAYKGILSYLENQNRPFSVNDIFQNLHQKFGKTLVQKSLDILVTDEKVQEKVRRLKDIFWSTRPVVIAIIFRHVARPRF